jgi:hypothetical protein
MMADSSQNDLPFFHMFCETNHAAPRYAVFSEGWRKLHNKKLGDLYFSPSFIRIIKSRMMGWGGHAARMDEI